MTRHIHKRLKKIGETLRKDYNAKKVILYGSYAAGKETPDSDIDILVIAHTEDGFFDRMAMVRRLIRGLRNGLSVSPLILTPEEVNKRIEMGDHFIKGIIRNGIRL